MPSMSSASTIASVKVRTRARRSRGSHLIPAAALLDGQVKDDDRPVSMAISFPNLEVAGSYPQKPPALSRRMRGALAKGMARLRGRAPQTSGSADGGEPTSRRKVEPPTYLGIALTHSKPSPRY